MSRTSKASHAARPPGLDWEDSYFSLEERYRRLQQRFNEQESELKRRRVAERRAASRTGRSAPAAAAELISSSSSLARTAAAAPPSHLAPKSKKSVSFATPQQEEKQQPPLPPSTAALHPATEDAHGESNHVDSAAYVPVPPSNTRADAAQAAALSELSMWSPELSLPDPAMIWGSEESVRNYVAASALYHANEELRRRLAEAATLQQAVQLELAAACKGQSNARSRVDDLTLQLQQAVRERDAASGKLHSLQQTVQSLEQTLQEHIAGESKRRFALESQITELRGRLVAGADSNELLSRDLRALLNEAREKTSEAMALRSKLALAESALAAQKSTNENLLVELQGMNAQLVDARKRLIATAHDAERIALDAHRRDDLEGRLRQVMSERDSLEKAHVALMGEFVQVNARATREAAAEVQRELADWQATAAHWEEVAQLLYKDVSERTAAHVRCREECEAAKSQRDRLALSLREARTELETARAKLAVAWPSHAMDAGDLSAEEIRETFRLPHHLTFAASTAQQGTTKKAAAAEEKEEEDAATGGAEGKRTTTTEEEEYIGRGVDGTLPLPPDPTTHEEKLHELHEANASLVAQLAQLRMSNELLQERITSLTTQQSAQRAAQASELQSHAQREAAGQALLAKQIDRVGFLEAQVRSLRGYRVGNDVSLDQTSPNELILELFLGQLVATQAAPALYVAPEFASVFCSVDFLLHETVTTRTITGLNGFFDTTISFCISMDALLLYYLQTRELLVQLHRVRTAAEVEEQAAEAEEGRRAGAGQTPHGQTLHVRSVSEEEAEERSVTSESHTRRPLSYDSALRPNASSPPQTAAAAAADNTSVQGVPGDTTMAEHLFETIAEGRVSLLDLVLDEECRTASRPTLHGHVKLFTPREEHIASLEFQLTARAPFTSAFRELIAQAFPEGEGAGKATGEGGGGGQPLAQLRDGNAGVLLMNKENMAGQRAAAMNAAPDTPAQVQPRSVATARDQLRTLQRTTPAPFTGHTPPPSPATAAISSQAVPRDLRAWVQSASRHRDEAHVNTSARYEGQPSRGRASRTQLAPNASSLQSSSYYSYSYYYYTTNSSGSGSSSRGSDSSPTHSPDGHRRAASVTSTYRDAYTLGSSTLYRRRFRTRHAAGDAVRLFVSHDSPRSASQQQQQAQAAQAQVQQYYPSTPAERGAAANAAHLVDESATASSTSSLFVHHRARLPPAPPPPMRPMSSSSPVRTVSPHTTTPQQEQQEEEQVSNSTVQRQGRRAASVAAATPVSEATMQLHVAHLPRYLLPSSASASPAANDRASLSLSSSSPAEAQLRRAAEGSLVREVRAVLVDVVRVELPPNLPGVLPRLGCYFGLRALQEERWLRAPGRPRYTITYDDQGRDGETGEMGSVFAVRSLAELAAIAREPLTLFFIHEDDPASNDENVDSNNNNSNKASLDSVRVWGLTTCEWAEALAQPGVAQSYSLPLLRQNAILQGATVRVRLMALVRDVLRPAAPASAAMSQATPSPATAVVVDTHQQQQQQPSLQQLEQELMKLELNRTSRNAAQ